MYRVYRIEEGDTMEKIARMYQTSVEQLEEMNGIVGSYQLIPGNFLVVPVEDNENFSTYVIQKGDNIYKIAQMYEVPYETLLLINGLEEDEYVYPGERILVPKEEVFVYVTKQADTINTISKNFKITPAELFYQNENLVVVPDQIVVYKKEQNF